MFSAKRLDCSLRVEHLVKFHHWHFSKKESPLGNRTLQGSPWATYRFFLEQIDSLVHFLAIGKVHHTQPIVGIICRPSHMDVKMDCEQHKSPTEYQAPYYE